MAARYAGWDTVRATRYIDTLNYEGVNDPGLRESLRKSRGLCNRHAWEWSHVRGSPLGVAIVYQNLVRDLAEVVANGKARYQSKAMAVEESGGRWLLRHAVQPAWPKTMQATVMRRRC